jgi:nicotinamide phosphoribosyltransferase
MKLFPPTLVDGYKVDHRRQYPDNTELVFSNLTPRGTRRKDTDKVVIFGLQYFIKRYLIESWNKDFFERPLDEVLKQFTRRINNYLGPNNVGQEHIANLHKLGYLPITIMALPEGTEYALRVPSVVVWNNHKNEDGTDYGWLTGWITNQLETIMSATVWLPCTSATTALQYRRLLNAYAMKTVGNTDFVQWQGHDFSFRGMAGLEAAVMSGAGHLLSFTGTDTVPAIDFLEQYYNANSDKELVGGSVAATEHSVMCAGGMEDEYKTFLRLITEIYPEGIVSIVSDTWDFWNTITVIAAQLKPDIMKRNGKVVFRPDSGDPVKVVVGYTEDEVIRHEDGKTYVKVVTTEKTATGNIVEVIKLGREISDAEFKGAIECLWEVFGGTVSEQGYKVLDSHVGLIYGDSITLERAKAICEGLAAKGFASTNIVFGIGSFTYQYVTRDTDQYAVKATYAEINGKQMEIFKAPKGDAMKKSAKGLTAVFKTGGDEYILKDQATWDDVLNCAFVKVFENGKIIKDYTLQEVRDNLAKHL